MQRCNVAIGQIIETNDTSDDDDDKIITFEKIYNNFIQFLELSNTPSNTELLRNFSGQTAETCQIMLLQGIFLVEFFGKQHRVTAPWQRFSDISHIFLTFFCMLCCNGITLL